MQKGLFLAAVLAVSGTAGIAVSQPVPSTLGELARGFAPVVQQAGPAVVNIYSRRIVAGRAGPFAGDPFFDRFFQELAPTTPRVQSSLGSGVIVSQDGLVVTNFHVVGGASDITVVLPDRREFAAEVVLEDEPSDLAVLRIRSDEPLPTIGLRDSEEVMVGDLVLAIGNPFGLGQTVSMGIISGLARSALSVGDGRGYFLQTDAAINPGNSGGALVDTQGRLVGINTAILTRSGGSQGVGFAIPANLVASVVEQARGGARVFRRPWAGVNAQAVDGGLAEAMGLPRPEGVALIELHSQSPFRAAGLRPNDVVLSIGGDPVNSPQEMLFRLASSGIGGEIEIAYIRDGIAGRTTVALIAPPESPPRDTLVLSGRSVLSGLAVARINPAVLAELDLPGIDLEGVAVLAAEGVAAQVGIRRGDILLSVNGVRVTSPAEAEAASRADVRGWAIEILREGRRVLLRFRI